MPQLNSKRVVCSLFLLMMVLAIAWTSYAWLTSEQRIVTGAAVVTPHTLSITAANRESVANIDIGNIDVQKEGVNAYRVPFAVTGIPQNTYKIQLAYTTNIQFTYKIYRATLLDAKPDNSVSHAVYVSPETGESFYFALGDVFMDEDHNAVPVDSSYSYSNTAQKSNEYGHVQNQAVPKYMQEIVRLTNTPGQFTHYYVLSIEWGNDIKNNKETDIIYITAEFWGG